MADTLLVLGNGFDLACGLNSRFRDYLDSDFYKDYNWSKDCWILKQMML